MNTLNSLTHNSSKLIITGTLAGIAYQFLDAGIANVLALQTLRHGTSIKNFFQIIWSGPDPSAGGNDTGASEGQGIVGIYEKKDAAIHKKNSEKFFHLAKSFSPEFSLRDVVRSSPLIIDTYFYSFLSNTAMLHKHLKRLPKILKIAIAAFLTTQTPFIKVNITSKQIQQYKLEDDPDAGCFDNYYFAYRTSQAISPWHLGITGSLLHGCNWEWFQRAAQHPSKVLKGILYCTLSILLFKKAANLYVAY